LDYAVPHVVGNYELGRAVGYAVNHILYLTEIYYALEAIPLMEVDQRRMQQQRLDENSLLTIRTDELPYQRIQAPYPLRNHRQTRLLVHLPENPSSRNAIQIPRGDELAILSDFLVLFSELEVDVTFA
jgi:hypothetical protein